jgi:hypothetical protein
MVDLTATAESWFDSPGDLLAIASFVAVVLAGILWLIDARLSTIRTEIRDMREANDDVHNAIREQLSQHMASPMHDRRKGDIGRET